DLARSQAACSGVGLPRVRGDRPATKKLANARHKSPRLDMQRRTFQRISERLDATDAALSEAPTDARAVQNVEPLGSKIIEGLPSDGRRIVQDVDFGAEHSELGVTVTTEIWVASELGVPVLVLMTSSNGRQTRYALRNVRFEETSPAQFV